jgi:hypothetical protein
MTDWQRLAIRIVLFADFVIFAHWVVQYARVSWRSTPVGRHLMALGVVLTALLGLTFLRAWLGPLVFWLWLVGLVALGAVGVQRTVLLFRAQKASRGRDDDSTVDKP